jgi:hypothetical protein
MSYYILDIAHPKAREGRHTYAFCFHKTRRMHKVDEYGSLKTSVNNTSMTKVFPNANGVSIPTRDNQLQTIGPSYLRKDSLIHVTMRNVGRSVSILTQIHHRTDQRTTSHPCELYTLSLFLSRNVDKQSVLLSQLRSWKDRTPFHQSLSLLSIRITNNKK